MTTVASLVRACIAGACRPQQPADARRAAREVRPELGIEQRRYRPETLMVRRNVGRRRAGKS